MRGKFITFEGIEGCGKSTQVHLLCEHFASKGIPHLKTREPGGTPISEKIRDIILDVEHTEMWAQTELLLYSASRAQHTLEKILPALEKGIMVVSDRYYDSSFAYQGAARHLDIHTIQLISRFATADTCPDLTFLLDLPVEAGQARIRERQLDRLELETLSFHRQVREEFLSIAKKEAFRYVVLDGTKSPQDLHQQVLEAINTRLQEIFA